MSRRIALALIGVCGLAGCARHPFDVTDADGAFHFTGSKGGCFVGCKLNVRNRDGTLCRGHVAAIDEGYPIEGGISCEGRAAQTLHVEEWRRGASVAGNLDGQPVTATFR